MSNIPRYIEYNTLKFPMNGMDCVFLYYCMLGLSTGRPISELLSLTIGDVYQNGKAVTL